jgi:hypothetical protein
VREAFCGAGGEVMNHFFTIDAHHLVKKWFTTSPPALQDHHAPPQKPAYPERELEVAVSSNHILLDNPNKMIK